MRVEEAAAEAEAEAAAVVVVARRSARSNIFLVLGTRCCCVWGFWE